MSQPNATLGGVPLADAAAVSWTQTIGPAAHTQEFVVHEKQWDRLKDKIGKPLDLVIEADNAPKLTWKNLFILREAPTAKPFHRAFVVADVRWKWPRMIVSRAYNVPRKTGNRRMVGASPIELAQGVDTYGYAITTLKPNLHKWTAREVVEDVLGVVAKKCGHSWAVHSFPVGEQRQVTVEGLDMTEGGDVALGHALRHVPGAEVTIDREGRAIIFDATDQSEVRAQISDKKPRTAAGQIDRLIDLRAIRPASVMVYFQREVELRFDSIEEDDNATVQTYRDPGLNPEMTMENVVPLPDPETTIRGQKVAQGTYVPLLDAVTAWNTDLASIGRRKTPPPLTLANIRKYWFHLEELYAPLGYLVLSAAQCNWAARIDTLRTHFRQTFRIRTSWMQRMRGLSPTRVGVLDYVTRTRNPSRAWSQFMVEPTEKAHVLGSMASDDKHWYWMSVDNYPGIDGELTDNSSSPAVVQVVDADLGILHINYRLGQFGMRASVHPSMMKRGGNGRAQAPTRDLSKQLTDVMCLTGHCSGAAPTQLADDFRVAVVFTASPFAPNDEGRLFGYRVEPSAVSGFVASTFEVAGGGGPAWELFCPPSLMTARYAWTTTSQARESAKRLFGFEGGLPAAGSNRATEAAGYNIVNLGEGGDGLIQAVAKAMAVAQWAAFTSKIEGAAALHLSPGIDLVGGMDYIRHMLETDGRLLTEVGMSGARRPMDPMAFLPQSVRTAVLGAVNGGVA